MGTQRDRTAHHSGVHKRPFVTHIYGDRSWRLNSCSILVFEINESIWTIKTVNATMSSMSDLIGYARVSTSDQNAQAQLDALHKAGCLRVFTDKAKGAIDERPELSRMLDQLRPGDTVVVWKLDRLGRNLRHLIQTVESLGQQGVGFKSLTEGIDTTSPGGRLLFHLIGAVAQFERDLIAERTRAGLEAARARGRRGGRPRSMDDTKVIVAREMYEARRHTVAEIASTLGVSRATIYRSLATS